MRASIVALLLGLAVSPAAAQDAEAAIAKGVAWLKKAQKRDGSWQPVRSKHGYGGKETRYPYVRDPTGPTSWALYTLSKCGVKKSDPVIKNGHRWLQTGKKMLADGAGERGLTGQTWKAGKAWDVTGDDSRDYYSSTYESAALILMLEAMSPSKVAARTKNPLKVPRGSRMPKHDWRWMHERVLWLTVGKRGKLSIRGCQQSTGGWDYGQGRRDAEDLATTHFCLVGLRAAARAGYPVEKTSSLTWLRAAKFCKSVQRDDGGFSYHRKVLGVSAGMTACGVASLLICKEQIARGEKRVPGWIDDAVARGMKRLDALFDVTRNQGEHITTPYHYYYLWTIQQVGVLSGRREIGGVDWYEAGKELLLRNQDAAGMWVDASCAAPRDVLGTCFALLFLRKATSIQ